LTSFCDLDLDGTNLGLIRDTPSRDTEHFYEIFLKIGEKMTKLWPGQEFANGRTDTQPARRPDDGDHNIIRPFGRIKITSLL